MTDTVVYETKNKPTYVIQFETENGEWEDTAYPVFRTQDAAIAHLNSASVRPYEFRIVRREKENN